MGTITAGTGLISGLDTAGLIDSLLTLASGPRLRLQARAAELTAQKTALLSVNSTLLALKTSAGTFRRDSVFQTKIGTSSNSEILGVSTTKNAQTGAFKFIVKQLVSTSQKITTNGFATRDESPLGLDDLSFEFGKGRVSTNEDLANLNGGTGVSRGSIVITDKDGNEATIDLTAATTVEEVLSAINSEASISVTASVDSDGLVITDTSGGSGTLSIADAVGSTTATDLGIDDAVATNDGTTSTGASIYSLAGTTPLKSLNDGNGVLIRANNPDITITTLAGDTIDVDFGRINNDIDDSTLLEDLNDGAGVRIDSDTDTPDIKFTDRDGNEYEIDLSGITTVGQLRSRVDAQTAGRINITITNGDKFTVTDTVNTGSGNLKVEGTEEAGDDVAEDLGILNVTGAAAATFDGEVIPSTIDKPEATTLQDIIDRINDHEDNAGKILVSIRADGKGLRVQDQTGGGGTLSIASTATNPDAASDLGIEFTTASNDYTSTDRVLGGLDTVLIKSLNGGLGLNGATTISVTDRSGASYSKSDLDVSGYETLQELIDDLNQEFNVVQNIDVTFGINEAGNGLVATDTSGATTNNFQISGDGATALGLTFDDDETTAVGTNLQRKYVGNATRLEDLNYGRGIGTGSFTITDGLGASATVSIGGTESTLYDIIQEIESKGLAINARVNDNGDGLIIEEDMTDFPGQTAAVAIKVTATSGTTARDLNILGESTDVEGGYIDGSYERTVDLATSDSLDEVVTKINDAGIPVTASVVNTGSGATPFHLNLTSTISGAAGDMIIDTGGKDFGFNTLARGEDAKVFFGADRPEDAFLVTSNENSLDSVLTGVTISLNKASDEVVTINIEKNDAAVLGAVVGFQEAYNDVVDQLATVDFFDVENEERGILFGNSTISNVRSSLVRLATGRPLNVEGQLQYLSQIGFSIDRDGKLQLDQAKFSQRFEEDPEGVEALLAAYDIEVGGSQEVADGVSIETTGTTYNSLGIFNRFDVLLDQLTNSIDGTLTEADDAFQTQIDDLNDRIELLDDRLEERRERLTREFANLETVIADLQSQGAALGSLSVPSFGGIG